VKVELTNDWTASSWDPRRVVRIHLTSPEARTVANGGEVEMEFYVYSGARPTLVQVVRDPR
jgi:hypothetical protein